MKDGFLILLKRKYN